MLCAVAAMIAAAAALLLVLAPGGPAARGSPWYFAVMLPLALWAVPLLSYAPWPVRHLRLAIAGAPALCLAAVLRAAWSRPSTLALCCGLLAIATAAAAAAYLAYRGSLLVRAAP